MHLCVLRGSQNKERLFFYTALNYRFLKPNQSVYCAVRSGSLNQTDTVSYLRVKTYSLRPHCVSCWTTCISLCCFTLQGFFCIRCNNQKVSSWMTEIFGSIPGRRRRFFSSSKHPGTTLKLIRWVPTPVGPEVKRLVL